MSRSRPRWVIHMCFLLLVPLSAMAQGTLDDYQRAERFLPQKMRKLVFSGDVAPHWIEKSNRFWHRAVGPKGAEFKLVDAEKNTIAPAFDHEQIAAAMSKAAKREFKPTELPFESFEFAEGG